jgi:hypothetical protein
VTPEKLIEQLALVDVGEVADAIAGNPLRNAMKASTIEIVALALRLRDLEAAASAAFALLTSVDELAEETCFSLRTPSLRALVERHTEALSSALAALGYVPKPKEIVSEPTHI